MLTKPWTAGDLISVHFNFKHFPGEDASVPPGRGLSSAVRISSPLLLNAVRAQNNHNNTDKRTSL